MSSKENSAPEEEQEGSDDTEPTLPDLSLLEYNAPDTTSFRLVQQLYSAHSLLEECLDVIDRDVIDNTGHGVTSGSSLRLRT